MLLLDNQYQEDLLSFKPLVFRLANSFDKQELQKLIDYQKGIKIHDKLSSHLDELVKSMNPGIKKPSRELIDQLKKEHLGDCDLQEYGVWVYYPWSQTLVHCLDEEEFVEVRTNRNRYKITREEQAILKTKKIGVVGLSVGQSIALTLAMERTCGELRLADFDIAELSNLNRLRTGIHNIGLSKTVIAAREIAEIDPFLKVEIYNDGLVKENIDQFFTAGGKLDLLIEVCDGLDIKIESRFKAKSLGIPVVMDTNDRGMLDVERFDLEPNRPILHGLADGLNPENIKNLTNEEKIPYVLKMIGAESISTRLKASMLEVEQSVNTWPQLASSVVLGGALTTDVSRRILLDQYHDSGRYYIDLEELVCDKKKAETSVATFDGPSELQSGDLMQIASSYQSSAESMLLDDLQMHELLAAAIQAPSGGNAQPWKFLDHQNELYIFHDSHYSYSLLDYNNLGSYIGFGAMLENIKLVANSLGIDVKETVFPIESDKRLVAVLSFSPLLSEENELSHLAPMVSLRVTNRNVNSRELLPAQATENLKKVATSIPGARLDLFDQADDLHKFAEILTNCERLRFMHPRGHYDTFVKELRFTDKEITETADGLDVGTLNMTASELAALQIAKDPMAISYLHQWEKGHGFKKISNDSIINASAIGVISMPDHTDIDFLNGGRAVERVWLEASYQNIAIQPISQIIFLNELFQSPEQNEFNKYECAQLQEINERFNQLLSFKDYRHPVFVFRLSLSHKPEKKALRRPLTAQFFQTKKSN
jgi:hypothetical protein